MIKINKKELEEFKKRNFEQRLEFIKKYTDWLKKTSNKEWSKIHKKFID